MRFFFDFYKVFGNFFYDILIVGMWVGNLEKLDVGV